MERKPHPPQTAIMLALGLGQTIAFASSFYLMGVLGDDIAADLRLAPTFVFSLMSVALAASAVAAPSVGRWVDAHGGKATLLISNLVFAAGLGLIGLAQGPIVLTLGMIVLGLAMALGLYGTPFAILVAGAWFISTCMSTHLPRLFLAFGLSRTTAMSTAALVGVAAVAVRTLEFAVLRRFPPLMATRAATLMHPLGAAARPCFRGPPSSPRSAARPSTAWPSTARRASP